MAGRKPQGARLARHTEGSAEAKERAETILETLTGGLPIKDACRRLGINAAMVNRLRMRGLQSLTSEMEPRRRGRRPKALRVTQAELDAQAAHIAELERQLQEAQTLCEVAGIAPERVAAALKKTNCTATTRRRRPR